MQTVTGTSDSGASPNVTEFALALDSNLGLPTNTNGFRARIECDVAPSAQVESCYVDVVLRDGASLDVSPVYRQSFGQLANSFTCKLALNVDFTVSPLLSNGPFTVRATVTMTGATTISFTLFNAVLTLEGFYIGT